MPLFTVAIPTYNRLALLKRAIESVRAQYFRDFELVVVDDGSTDGTREWLTEYCNDVRILEQVNAGPGAARNFAIRSASGEYIAFLDSDDLWTPWTLAMYADVIDRFQRPALIAGKIIEFVDESEIRALEMEELKVEHYADYLAAADKEIAFGSNAIAVRADALRIIGGFIEDRLNCEDHDLTLRLGTQRGFALMIAPAVVGYRQHQRSETRDKVRTAMGVLRLLRRESEGVYPGGAERQLDRHQIMTRHARAAAVACLTARTLSIAWKLYSKTISSHISLRRWKFVLGFPLMVIWSMLGLLLPRDSDAVRAGRT